MNEQDDPTVILQMKRDFDQLVSGTSSQNSHLKLDLDQTLSFRTTGSNSAISVKSLLEKERENALKQAEFIKAKSEITKLKSDLQSVETSRKRARIEYEKDVSSLKEEKEICEQRLSDMKAQLHYLSEKEQKVKEDLLLCQQNFKEYKQNHDQKLLSINAEKVKLEDELIEAKKQSWEKASEMQSMIFELESKNSTLQQELEESKMQMSLQMNKTQSATSQIKSLEEYRMKAQQSEIRIKTLEMQISKMEEDGIIVKAMKGQLSRMPELEKENSRLKEENLSLRDIQENNLLLKEQTESMRQKLERSEKRCERLSELEAENLDLKAKLTKWESAETQSAPMQNPSQLCKRLAYLQESEAVMLEKQGQLQSSLHSSEESRHSLQQRFDQLEAVLSSEKNKNQQLSQLVKRLQRKLLLISKERDMYKRVLDSYENDVTINVASNMTARVSQLEDVVEGYRKQMESLETELSKSTVKTTEESLQRAPKTDKDSATHSDISADRTIILQLRERIAALEKELEKVTEEKYVLETRIEQRHLQGDYDPTKLKVLHFTMNPATKAQQERREELTRLHKENEKLKNRVKILEESGSEAMDVTNQVEIKMKEPSTSKELEEMKQQVEKEELKNKRLMEAFRKTTQEFREMCYQVLGYKIDKLTSNKYKLTSMYAESQEDYFLFEVTPEGEVQFLATDFAETLQEHIDLYISKHKSIPAFLSAATIDLFQRQTMSVTCS